MAYKYENGKWVYVYTSPKSDDRSNSKNSWVYQGNSSWRQTY